jgi:hypothetical protein
VLIDENSSAAELLVLHPVRLDELDRLEPKLGVTVAGFDVDMGWLEAFVTEEEEPKSFGDKDRRHAVATVARARDAAATRAPVTARAIGSARRTAARAAPGHDPDTAARSAPA